MVVISLSLGLFGVFSTLCVFDALGALGIFGTRSALGIGAQILPPRLDREPLVVTLGPSTEVLEKVEVRRRRPPAAFRLPFLRAYARKPRAGDEQHRSFD